ncbi:hypothetical protein B0H14DRAFT_3131278 [Mycena olivaceomarginata]|nr:hypothetical protein B0H14DRAFT_3131278 [Mycena olivaceomarginata]
MASTFKFLFRPPYIRPDVVKLGDNGDLLACGGIDGRLNIFSLVRGIHLTTMVFPAPISALTWESTTLIDIWKLWIGMRDGSVDSLSIAVEKGAQGRSESYADTGAECGWWGTNHPDNVQEYCRYGNDGIPAKDTHGQYQLNLAGMQHECTESSILDRWMAAIHRQCNPDKNADGGGPIMMTNFGAPKRRISQAIQIANRVILTARGQENRRKEIGRIEDQGAEDAVGRQRSYGLDKVDTSLVMLPQHGSSLQEKIKSPKIATNTFVSQYLPRFGASPAPRRQDGPSPEGACIKILKVTEWQYTILFPSYELEQPQDGSM